MAIGVWLGSHATGADVSLSDASYVEVLEFDMGYGDVSEKEVTGTLRLRIRGTKAQVVGEIQAIQKYLQKAESYQARGLGGAIVSNEYLPVYLYVRLHGTTDDVNRSPITAARYSITNESIYKWDVECIDVEYLIDFTRRNYWEGAQEAVPLTTKDIDDSLAPVTVHNPTDSGDVGNWVEIASADIAGDLPGSTVIYFQNVGGAQNPLAVHIGQWLKDDESYPSPNEIIVMEAENGTVADPADVIAAVDASGGEYVDYSETYPVVSPIELVPIAWNLSRQELQIYDGRYYKFLVYLYDSTNASNHNYQLRLKRGTTVIFEGPVGSLTTLKGTASTDIRDLGVFRLPPMEEQLIGSPHPLMLELVITPATTAILTGAIKIDYMIALPVDGYRYIQSIGPVANNDYIVDDGTIGVIYGQHIDGNYPDIIGYGNQILLVPSYVNRLYFMVNDDINYTGSVNMYYRPRRLSIGNYTA